MNARSIVFRPSLGAQAEAEHKTSHKVTYTIHVLLRPLGEWLCKRTLCTMVGDDPKSPEISGQGILVPISLRPASDFPSKMMGIQRESVFISQKLQFCL